MQLQARCKCNVRMNTFYTWKPYSNIYWNNSETIILTGELRAWMKVTQNHWHNCKEKFSEKWRNIGENRRSEIYLVTLAIKIIILVIVALDLEEVGWSFFFIKGVSLLWRCGVRILRRLWSEKSENCGVRKVRRLWSEKSVKIVEWKDWEDCGVRSVKIVEGEECEDADAFWLVEMLHVW